MGQKLLLLLCPILLFSCLANRVAAAEVSVADSIKKYRFLARTSREKNDFVAATGYYGEYLKYETQPKRRKLALYYLGRMHYKNKQPAAAGQAFLQVVELDSLHINSNLMLYEAFKASHPDTAARALERGALSESVLRKRRSAAVRDGMRRLLENVATPRSAVMPDRRPWIEGSLRRET